VELFGSNAAQHKQCQLTYSLFWHQPKKVWKSMGTFMHLQLTFCIQKSAHIDVI